MLSYLILQMQEGVIPNCEQFFPTLVEYINIFKFWISSYSRIVYCLKSTCKKFNYFFKLARDSISAGLCPCVWMSSQRNWLGDRRKYFSLLYLLNKYNTTTYFRQTTSISWCEWWKTGLQPIVHLVPGVSERWGISALIGLLIGSGICCSVLELWDVEPVGANSVLCFIANP